jgi:hypothetical protein
MSVAYSICIGLRHLADSVLIPHLLTSSLSGESYTSVIKFSSIAVAVRSKAWVYGRWLAGVAGSSPAEGMDVSLSCKCCVPSGRGLCDGTITHPEECCRVWCT